MLLDCTASFVTVIFSETLFRLRIARAMSFPRINCNATTVTELAASAATTLSLPVCVCAFPSQPSSHGGHGGYRPQCLLPKQLGTGEPCDSCQDSLTKPPSQDKHEDRQERRVPATHRRPDFACSVLPHRGTSRSECGLLSSFWCCVPILSHAPPQAHRKGDLGDEVDCRKGQVAGRRR